MLACAAQDDGDPPQQSLVQRAVEWIALVHLLAVKDGHLVAQRQCRFMRADMSNVSCVENTAGNRKEVRVNIRPLGGSLSTCSCTVPADHPPQCYSLRALALRWATSFLGGPRMAACDRS